MASRDLQTSPNSHLPARDAPKDQNEHLLVCTPKPSSVSSEQQQTYPNSHPLVEDIPGPTHGRRVQIRVGLELTEAQLSCQANDHSMHVVLVGVLSPVSHLVSKTSDVKRSFEFCGDDMCHIALARSKSQLIPLLTSVMACFYLISNLTLLNLVVPCLAGNLQRSCGNHCLQTLGLFLTQLSRFSTLSVVMTSRHMS